MEEKKTNNNKIEYSNTQKIAFLLKKELKMQWKDIPGFLEHNSYLLEVDANSLKGILIDLDSKYLLTNGYIMSLMLNYPEVIKHPELFKQKQSLLRMVLPGLGDVDFGRILRNNPNILLEDDNEMLKFMHNLITKCGVNRRFIKNLLIQTIHFKPDNSPQYFEEMNERLQYFKILGLTAEDLSNDPAICANSLLNTVKKSKIALIQGVSIYDYLNFKFQTKKEGIYARLMAKRTGVIKVDDIYMSERSFRLATNLTTETLMKIYPYTQEADSLIETEFSQLYPKLDAEINRFLKTSKYYNDPAKEISEEKEENI